jgi:hypothetical protein
MDEEIKKVRMEYIVDMDSEFIIRYLIGFSMSGDCPEGVELMMQQAAGRIYYQRKNLRFLIAGLIVTNGLWAAYHYGILG